PSQSRGGAAPPGHGCAMRWKLIWGLLAAAFAFGAVAPDARTQLRASLCRQEDGRPNFFLLFPQSRHLFGQTHFATLESVLFHHPAANVLVLGFDLPEDLFDAYLLEGYCVTFQPISSPGLSGDLVAAVGDAAAPFLARYGQPQTEADLARLLNAILLSQQVLHGGTSLPMDGLLLNPWDLALPPQLLLQSSAVFLEKLEGVELPWALQVEDFERSWLPRSHVDRADGATSVCLEVMCPRTLPRGSSFGQQMLQWTTANLGPEGADLNQAATMLYRLYVQQRPARTPFQAGEVIFNHELVLLPYWVQMQPHFSDGWKDFGGVDGELTQHTALHWPRHSRAAADWSLVSTARLWLPLSFGPPSSRQAMPQSVIDLALRYFTLDLAPWPFRKKGFRNGRKKRPSRAKRLRSPADFTAENTGFIDEVNRAKGVSSIREGGLPGSVGGFRSFKELRLVGHQQQGLQWQVAVAGPGLSFFCRREHRRSSWGSTPGAVEAPVSSALRTCEAGLRPPGDAVQFCGSPAEVNAALSLLAYHPVAMPSVANVSEPRRDARMSADELEAHFSQLRVSARPGCEGSSTADEVTEVQFAALLDDVEELVTVVAHCAERCHLLERLAASFREAYAKLPIIATCECAEDQECLQPAPRAHDTVPHFTVVSVPYDFGLSRGKTLLVEMTHTEFVLVLDDDFTHSMHSCLECMLWKMRSRHYSAWKPFDVLGFPVQEDERIFGAFRGSFRVTNQQLFLEPMVEELLPDGCMRVEICPMVFLGRTARMRTFHFQKDLRVGEHEQFFYSNAYNGVQVAVCFDSSFPHFRVNTMSAGYVKRRERMPELMANAFEKLGFERAMFLFRKYDQGRMEDYDELLEKTVPPWHVGHDSCGPPTSPPVPFAQLLLVLLSSADERGRAFRSVLRTVGWQKQFQELAGAGALRWVFAVHPRADEAKLFIELEQEHKEHQDLLILPPADRTSTSAEATTDQMIQVLALLRDFQFRWLVVARQDVFVRAGRFLDELQGLEPPGGKVLGSWSRLPGGWRLDPHFFVLPRDVFVLLSAPELISRLAVQGFNQAFGDLSNLDAGVSTWMHAFAVERLQMRASQRGQALACPADTVTLYPISPEELAALGRSPAAFGC
ncbi:unnamed protein product, partial [Effrenium voratum]